MKLYIWAIIVLLILLKTIENGTVSSMPYNTMSAYDWYPIVTR